MRQLLLLTSRWLRWSCWLACVLATALSSTQAAGATETVLEVYVREGCPHCAAAKAYLPQFQQARPWLQVVYRPVDQDDAAREDLIRISRDSGLWPPGVPTFVYRGQVLVGFADAELSGSQLAQLVEQHRPPPVDTGQLDKHLDAGFWGTLSRSLALSLLGVASLALAVNFIELLCTAGLPAMYTAILTQQELSPASHYDNLGLYILGYVVDDSLMVGTAVLALSQRRLDEGRGRWLKLVSGLVMLLRPDWLL